MKKKGKGGKQGEELDSRMGFTKCCTYVCFAHVCLHLMNVVFRL
jgi:hypothetical protein